MLAAVLRFYHLGQNPPSLNWDEVSNGYNAYSILKTARDEYGNFLPLTFRAFGDYNPALSVYTLVPSIAVFGLSEFAIRFPSALLGTLTVFLTYLLVKKLLANNILALIAAFFLAISPWHLQFSRYDHEANFMVFLTVAGLTTLMYSVKNPKLLSASALAFGLGINTYHGAKIWIPLIGLATLIFFGKNILKYKSQLIIPAIILAIFTFPIIANWQRATIRSSSVGIFASEQNPTKTFLSGYLSHFNPNFLFISGDNIIRHAVKGMGQLYVAELPLLIVGLISLVKSKATGSRFLLAWLLLAPIPASLATPTPHALRAITFMPIWHIISAFGLVTILTSSMHLKLKVLSLGFISVLGLYNFLTYLHLYYNHYPLLASIDWQDGYKDMVKYVDPIKDNYATVAMTNFYGHPYIFILFYAKFDPATYQKLPDKTRLGQYEFFGQSWEKKTPGLALVIRPDWQRPNPPPRYIKEIRDTSGQVIFKISEEE